MEISRQSSFSSYGAHADADLGVLQLPADPPAWIWAFTCPEPRCDCRTALVLATQDGRDALLTRGAPVHRSWSTRDGQYAAVAHQIEGMTAFELDIDTATIYPLKSDDPLNLARHPQIAAVARRLDGETLDWIGRLWHRGKGRSDPEQQILLTPQIEVVGWEPGKRVAWNELCEGLREDVYLLDGKSYEAAEFYCPVPDCSCDEVFIEFEPYKSSTVSHPGGVVVRLLGEATFDGPRARRETLTQLWDAYRSRYPRYQDRFAQRYTTVKTIGERFAPKLASRMPAKAGIKVGRNEPCPCGSGKKYKKCCGGVA